NPKETVLTVSRFNNPGNLSSWIWQWGKHSKDGNYTTFTCKVNVDGIDCNHICRGKGTSTSNAVSPLDINTQEAIEQELMEFIVEDTQPFHILKSKKFQRLIELLNSSFVIPCDKRLKALITDSYNLAIENLKLLLVENMTWCSLTLDLWTPTNITELNIDLDESGTAFDDIIPEGDEELLEEMTNDLNNSHTQRKKKININFPQDTDGLVDKVKNALYIAMERYYNIPVDEIILSALLDPRCKKLTFANHDQRINAENKLRILYNELLQTHESESTTSINSTTTRLNFHTNNPIQKYKDMMPNLARKYLGIPATSTPSDLL
ncbi:12307_t:CDS:2, partial [Funneliformis caledonium]